MAEYYWRHALCSSSPPSTTARNQASARDEIGLRDDAPGLRRAAPRLGCCSACSARYNRGASYCQRFDVTATVESLVARIRATAGGRPPTFTRLALAFDRLAAALDDRW